MGKRVIWNGCLHVGRRNTGCSDVDIKKLFLKCQSEMRFWPDPGFASHNSLLRMTAYGLTYKYSQSATIVIPAQAGIPTLSGHQRNEVFFRKLRNFCMDQFRMDPGLRRDDGGERALRLSKALTFQGNIFKQGRGAQGMVPRGEL